MTKIESKHELSEKGQIHFFWNIISSLLKEYKFKPIFSWGGFLHNFICYFLPEPST